MLHHVKPATYLVVFRLYSNVAKETSTTFVRTRCFCPQAITFSYFLKADGGLRVIDRLAKLMIVVRLISPFRFPSDVPYWIKFASETNEMVNIHPPATSD